MHVWKHSVDLEDKDTHDKYSQRHKLNINLSEHNKVKLEIKIELYFLNYKIMNQKMCYLRYSVPLICRVCVLKTPVDTSNRR